MRLILMLLALVTPLGAQDATTIAARWDQVFEATDGYQLELRASPDPADVVPASNSSDMRPTWPSSGVRFLVFSGAVADDSLRTALEFPAGTDTLYLGGYVRTAPVQTDPAFPTNGRAGWFDPLAVLRPVVPPPPIVVDTLPAPGSRELEDVGSPADTVPPPDPPFPASIVMRGADVPLSDLDRDPDELQFFAYVELGEVTPTDPGGAPYPHVHAAELGSGDCWRKVWLTPESVLSAATEHNCTDPYWAGNRCAGDAGCIALHCQEDQQCVASLGG